MAGFNQGTIVLKQKSTTQSNADVGWGRVFLKDDGSVYLKDSSGTENKVAYYSSAVSTKLLVLRTTVDTGTISTGAKKIFFQSPYAGTITRWRLISDVATIATVDIWKANGAIPTVANTITAAAKPALSSATVATSTTLTGWTTSVAVGDIFELNVDANSTSAVLNLELEIQVA